MPRRNSTAGGSVSQGSSLMFQRASTMVQRSAAAPGLNRASMASRPPPMPRRNTMASRAQNAPLRESFVQNRNRIAEALANASAPQRPASVSQQRGSIVPQRSAVVMPPRPAVVREIPSVRNSVASNDTIISAQPTRLVATAVSNQRAHKAEEAVVSFTVQAPKQNHKSYQGGSKKETQGNMEQYRVKNTKVAQKQNTVVPKENIMLTPSEQGKRVTLNRVSLSEVDMSLVMHVASGPNKGLLVCKQAADNQCTDSHISYLMNCTYDNSMQEDLSIMFWFCEDTTQEERVGLASLYIDQLKNNGTLTNLPTYIQKSMLLMRDIQFMDIDSISLKCHGICEAEEKIDPIVQERQVSNINYSPC